MEELSICFTADRVPNEPERSCGLGKMMSDKYRITDMDLVETWKQPVRKLVDESGRIESLFGP